MSILSTVKWSIRSLARGYNAAKTSLWLGYVRLRFPNALFGAHMLNVGPLPFVYVSRTARMRIGAGCTFANHTRHNTIGVIKPCSLAAHGSGYLEIGDRVGLSGVSVCAYDHIAIGDDVLIGANTFIFDTDFHSIDFAQRITEISTGNFGGVLHRPVRIESGAFIGANCIVTKGVTIGTRSIIGAGSVVTRDVPAGQIWAGNPAHFVRVVPSPREPITS